MSDEQTKKEPEKLTPYQIFERIGAAIDAHDEEKFYKHLGEIKKTEYDINHWLRDGTSLLHHAVKANKKDYIETLIENGASTEFRDIEGDTPLHYAARLLAQGQPVISAAKTLIENEADLSAKTHKELPSTRSNFFTRKRVADIEEKTAQELAPENYKTYFSPQMYFTVQKMKKRSEDKG